MITSPWSYLCFRKKWKKVPKWQWNADLELKIWQLWGEWREAHQTANSSFAETVESCAQLWRKTVVWSRVVDLWACCSEACAACRHAKLSWEVWNKVALRLLHLWTTCVSIGSNVFEWVRWCLAFLQIKITMENLQHVVVRYLYCLQWCDAEFLFVQWKTVEAGNKRKSFAFPPLQCKVII